MPQRFKTNLKTFHFRIIHTLISISMASDR
jgi:hypothetical protein